MVRREDPGRADWQGYFNMALENEGNACSVLGRCLRSLLLPHPYAAHLTGRAVDFRFSFAYSYVHAATDETPAGDPGLSQRFHPATRLCPELGRDRSALRAVVARD